MTDPSDIPFRSAHGFSRVDMLEREWHGISVRYLQPTPRSRYDAGFAVWVLAMHTVWGWSKKVSFARELRLTFDIRVLEKLLEDEFDRTLAKDPLIMLYDLRITQCAHLLADSCIEPQNGDRLFGEGITIALFSALFSAWRKKSPPAIGSGLASWQLKPATDYMQAHFSDDVSLAELAEITKLSQSQFARAFRDTQACRLTDTCFARG
jgi:AraC family transcriptional regulator